MKSVQAEPAQTAQQITKASNSNLALAFFVLPPQRRRDITTFYAFCRVVDDIADAPGVPLAERKAGLEQWRRSLEAPQPGESPLAAPVRNLMRTYRLTPAYFVEIIDGCEMDLSGARYERWEDLRLYCYRVASAVGLVSIEIFGYTDKACRRYAEELGLALQITNILRDVWEDYANGKRIYLPMEELAQFGYSEQDLAARVHNAAFERLMRFQCARARAHFQAAARALPPKERKNMIAAEIMRSVYGRILDRMERDRFRVFDGRYTLSKWEKFGMVAGVVARTKLMG